MQAIVYTAYGGPEVTQIQTVDKPTPAAGELLVRIVGGGLNPVDARERAGDFKLVKPFTFPQIAGSELSGIVAEIGPDTATEFRVGDAVMARVARTAALAEYITVRAEYCAMAPKSIPLAEAGGVPLASMTALQILDRLEVTAGERVLVTAGAGAVGLYAIQLAKLRGATVATTASSAGFSYVKDAGADEVIDYKSTTPAAYVANNDALKFDKVFDGAGGDDAAMASLFAATKRGGKVVTISGPPTPDAFADNDKYPMSYLWSWVIWGVLSLRSRTTRANAAAAGVSYQFMFNFPDGAGLQKIADLIDEGKVKTHVDSRYAFEDYAKAFERLESKRSKGKVIIEVGKA